MKHLRLSSDTLMCPQFKKLLIVIPLLVSFGMEPVAEDIKTCSLGIETLLLDSSGLSCTSLCVDNDEKKYFQKMCSERVNFLPNNKNYSRFEALRGLGFINLSV